MEETTAIATQKDYVNELIENIEGTRQLAYSSFNLETMKDEDKLKMFGLVNTPTHRLSDHINEELSIKEVYVEMVNCERKDEKGNGTGEFNACPRVILIDSKGESYQSVSIGVFSSLNKLFAFIGTPDKWKAPAKVKVVQTTKGDRKMLSLK